MSVIVKRLSDNKVFNFVKGADSVMMNEKVTNQDLSEIEKSVNNMAS